MEQEFRIKKGEKVKYRDIPAVIMKVCRWAYVVAIAILSKDVHNID